MASKLYFLKNFNNYHNRIIKKFDTIQEYLNAADDYAERGTSAVQYGKGPVNFNFNNGIDSTATYNYDENQVWQPDYVLVCDMDAVPATDKPNYCFFVMTATRTRKGQYHIILRRDVVADNYDKIIRSDMFIEKATVPNSSPFIYNEENVTFNQIKKNETLLLDKTNCAWIVGYIAEDINDEVRINAPLRADYNGSYNNFSDLPYYKFTRLSNTNYTAYCDTYINNNNTLVFNSSSDTYSFDGSSFTGPSSTIVEKLNDMVNTSAKLSTFKEAINKAYANEYANGQIMSQSAYNNFRNASGRVYKVLSETKTVQFSVTSNSVTQTSTTASSASELGILVRQYLSQYININTITVKREWYSSKGVYSNTTDSVNCVFGSTTRGLLDAPYRMFAMPYKIEDVEPGFNTVKINNETIILSSDIDFNATYVTAKELCKQMSGTSPLLYDIQVLPYCPFLDNATISNNILNISVENHDTVTALYKESGAEPVTINFMYWCDKSSFTFNINHVIDIRNKKIENQTDKYRLCSPNYNSIFEFNAARNDGVDYFNVDCTYKPFNSYIHVNPNFKNLYGADYDDPRGLICSGDFSFPQTSDAWATYQRNNVNYQNSLNRQIENMEVTQDIALKQQAWSMGAGIVQGTVSGAAAGLVGGAGGAAIGAVAGAAASTAGGIADRYYQKQLNAEAIDYTKDQFGYQLGNIKALPNTLSKVSSLTKNNKMVPVLEYYSCTDEEKVAFELKLYYNGMSVGVIGNIQQYLQTDISYIKCKAIRLENLGDDYLMSSEIADELNKGVFIK